MHGRTEATLQDLSRAYWFSRVGLPETDVEVLSSWQQAVEGSSSPDWRDLCLEAANQYRERLVERSVERFRRWNDLVAEIRPVAQLLVREKTRDVVVKNDLPIAFLNAVDWDIIHVCMEAEYADVYPPGFYASQAYWYANGRFPCGWQGEFPTGKLIIY